jgi:hypothetical protein
MTASFRKKSAAALWRNSKRPVIIRSVLRNEAIS